MGVEVQSACSAVVAQHAYPEVAGAPSAYSVVVDLNAVAVRQVEQCVLVVKTSIQDCLEEASEKVEDPSAMVADHLDGSSSHAHSSDGDQDQRKKLVVEDHVRAEDNEVEHNGTSGCRVVTATLEEADW